MTKSSQCKATDSSHTV